jgi:hypothetical protein
MCSELIVVDFHFCFIASAWWPGCTPLVVSPSHWKNRGQFTNKKSVKQTVTIMDWSKPSRFFCSLRWYTGTHRSCRTTVQAPCSIRKIQKGLHFCVVYHVFQFQVHMRLESKTALSIRKGKYARAYFWKTNRLLTPHIPLDFPASYAMLDNHTLWNYIKTIATLTYPYVLRCSITNNRHKHTILNPMAQIIPGIYVIYQYLSFLWFQYNSDQPNVQN